MNQNPESRRLFEAAMRERGWQSSEFRGGMVQDFAFPHTQNAWEGWQAARAQPQASGALPELRGSGFAPELLKAADVLLSAQTSTAQQEAALRERIRQIIIDHCTALYACTRVWEAWSVGTMTEDDFEPAAEIDFPDELADAILALLPAQEACRASQPSAEPDK